MDRFIALSLLVLAALAEFTACRATAQTASTAAVESKTYIFASVGGFIPMRQSYRLNYSTKTLGLPLEYSAGLIFPITPSIMTPLTVRYVHREANFISGTAISVLSIEPGVRGYLEKQRDRDIRIFAAGEALIAQASVASAYDLSQTGEVTGQETAHKSYLDLGLGFDVGFTYTLNESSALDAIVHAGIFLGSPVAQGGIGNIGGISLSASYRFGF